MCSALIGRQYDTSQGIVPAGFLLLLWGQPDTGLEEGAGQRLEDERRGDVGVVVLGWWRWLGDWAETLY